MKHCEKLKDFPLKSGIRQRWPMSLSLFNTELEILAGTIRQVKEVKGNLLRKETKIMSVCR